MITVHDVPTIAFIHDQRLVTVSKLINVIFIGISILHSCTRSAIDVKSNIYSVGNEIRSEEKNEDKFIS